MFVCLSVCKQGYAKPTGLIFMKLGGSFPLSLTLQSTTFGLGGGLRIGVVVLLQLFISAMFHVYNVDDISFSYLNRFVIFLLFETSLFLFEYFQNVCAFATVRIILSV